MRERWHKYLSKLVDKSFPTSQEETINPTDADQLYEAGVKLLINKTRDTKKYPLVYKENVLYGFCRNLYAMRRLGIFVSVVGVITTIAAGAYFLHGGSPQIVPWVCTAANVIFSICWLFKINSGWVKVPAFAYAERLFESTENITHCRKRDFGGRGGSEPVAAGKPPC
jgi:hypothetical protein